MVLIAICINSRFDTAQYGRISVQIYFQGFQTLVNNLMDKTYIQNKKNTVTSLLLVTVFFFVLVSLTV